MHPIVFLICLFANGVIQKCHYVRMNKMHASRVVPQANFLQINWDNVKCRVSSSPIIHRTQNRNEKIARWKKRKERKASKDEFFFYQNHLWNTAVNKIRAISGNSYMTVKQYTAMELESFYHKAQIIAQ